MHRAEPENKPAVKRGLAMRVRDNKTKGEEKSIEPDLISRPPGSLRFPPAVWLAFETLMHPFENNGYLRIRPLQKDTLPGHCQHP